MLRRVIALACLCASGCGEGGTVHDAAAPTDDDGGTRPDARPLDGNKATRLHVRVVEAQTRAPLPAMVALFPAAGGERLRFGRFMDDGKAGMTSETTVEAGIGGAMLNWHGIAVWRGEASVPVGVNLVTGAGVMDRQIPYGRYRLVANRGLEYDLAEATVDLPRDAGEVFVELRLPRTVDTSGYLAADMHVHSKKGMSDSGLEAEDRLKTMTVAGIEVVVATDHDYNVDYADEIRKLWPAAGAAPPLVSVPGNEASGADGHFNVFPVVVDRTRPRGGSLVAQQAWTSQQFMDAVRALPGRPFLQMNHTRGWAGYFELANRCGGNGPWRDRSRLPTCSVDFDGMEVLIGYLVCGTKIEEQLADWYALLGFGVVTTATGNSDTHGSSQLLGGFPRSYVRLPDDRVEAFRQEDFTEALRQHRVIATSGPFLTLRVNGGTEEGALVTQTDGKVSVSFRMQAASWVVVDEVRLKVNGAVVKTWQVPRVGEATPLLEQSSEPVEVTGDSFITVEAAGKKALPAHVVGDWTAQNPAACPASPGAEQGMAVFAVTNPVFVDVDGDGRYRGPRQPAVFPVPTR